MSTFRPFRPLFFIALFGIFTLTLCWQFQLPASISQSFKPVIAAITPSTLNLDFGMSLPHDSPNSPITNTNNPQWSSKFSEYLSRATPYPDPTSFSPKRSQLELVALRNAPIEPEGFTFALFSDRVFVDSYGKVYTLTPEDYEGLHVLSEQVTQLPTSSNFRNQWRIKHDRTSYPIDRILVAKTPLSETPAENYEEEYKEASVYGFDKQKTILQSNVGAYTHLAPSLFEIVGLALETRQGGDEKDESVLRKVKDTLGNVF